LEYEFYGFEKANIVKLVIHLMDEPVDALSFMVPEERAHQMGKKICLKLKENIP
jgi:GTP-binding protein LepA